MVLYKCNFFSKSTFLKRTCRAEAEIFKNKKGQKFHVIKKNLILKTFFFFVKFQNNPFTLFSKLGSWDSLSYYYNA